MTGVFQSPDRNEWSLVLRGRVDKDLSSQDSNVAPEKRPGR
jgi:hypothetical protein